MTKLSLFSGIGGDDLASEWAGITTVAFVERDKYCQKVLAARWPGVLIIGDVRYVTRAKITATIDILSAGVPCQPASIAGKRRGSKDDRWLWPEALRVLAEFKPTWALFENPSGINSLDEYRVSADLDYQAAAEIPDEYSGALDDICRQIEEIGYEVQPFHVPALAVGAKHCRYRVFIVGHSKHDGRAEGEVAFSPVTRTRTPSGPSATQQSQRSGCERGIVADASGGQDDGRERGNMVDSSEGTDSRRCEQCDEEIREIRQSDARSWPTQSRMGNVVDGFPFWLVEPAGVPRVATGVKDRVNKLRTLGNACVPQQIYPFYKTMVEIQNDNG